MTDLARLMQQARYELACDRCQNRGSITTQLGLDECPACQGFGRNKATLELLAALTERAQ